jgi:hypothetical protein
MNGILSQKRLKANVDKKWLYAFQKTCNTDVRIDVNIKGVREVDRRKCEGREVKQNQKRKSSDMNRKQYKIIISILSYNRDVMEEEYQKKKKKKKKNNNVQNIMTTVPA